VEQLNRLDPRKDGVMAIRSLLRASGAIKLIVEQMTGNKIE